jgi:hypothetical protein
MMRIRRCVIGTGRAPFIINSLSYFELPLPELRWLSRELPEELLPLLLRDGELFSFDFCSILETWAVVDMQANSTAAVSVEVFFMPNCLLVTRPRVSFLHENSQQKQSQRGRQVIFIESAST